MNCGMRYRSDYRGALQVTVVTVTVLFLKLVLRLL